MYLYDINLNQDNEDTKTGLNGTWSFTKNDKL